MQHLRTLTFVVLGAVFPAAALAQPSTWSSTAVADPKVRDHVAAIQAAAGPSEADKAYVAALSQANADPRVYEAYVRRLLDFGTPDRAEQAAIKLVELDPDNGLGYAIMAFNQARQGQMEVAFANLAGAVQLSRPEPFVLNLAGQLACWYDLQPDQTIVAPSIRKAVAKLRVYSSLADFQAGYREVNDAYASQAAGGAVAGNEPAPAGEPVSSGYTVSPGASYDVPYSDYGIYGYDNPYPYYGAYSPYYGYPFVSPFFFDFDDFGFRGRDHHRDRDHGDRGTHHDALGHGGNTGSGHLAVPQGRIETNPGGRIGNLTTVNGGVSSHALMRGSLAVPSRSFRVGRSPSFSAPHVVAPSAGRSFSSGAHFSGGRVGGFSGGAHFSGGHVGGSSGGGHFSGGGGGSGHVGGGHR